MQSFSQITDNSISEYIDSLKKSGKSRNTISKYSRDLIKFLQYLTDAAPDTGNGQSDVLLHYQQWLQAEGFGYRSINAYVSIAYQLCIYLDILVKQPKSLRPEVTVVDDREHLTRVEYQRLIRTAFKYDMEQLGMILQVMSGTPLQYDEMRYITVEMLNEGGVMEFDRNGTKMVVHLSEQLVEAILEYVRQKGIDSGCVFVNSKGNFPLRGNVWRSLKRLCQIANVDPDKVSLQKVKQAFAQEYYSVKGLKIKG